MAYGYVTRTMPQILGVLIVITLVPQVTMQDTLTFNAETTTGDSYYIGQPLTVTCRKSVISPRGLVQFGVRINDEVVGCNRDVLTGNWAPLRGAVPDGVTYEPDCDVPNNDNSVIIVFNISQELSSLTLICYDGNTAEFSATSLGMGTVKESPTNLKMSFNNEPVIENQTLTATCSSSSPQSVYKYELVKDGTSTVLTNGEHTLTTKDRNGFQIRCTDTGNPDWLVVGDVVSTTGVLPRYITRDWDLQESRDMKLNPASPKPIACDIEGNPTPTYTWTSNGTDLTSVTGNTFLVSMNSRENGDVEEIRCTASVDGVSLQLLITWIITWDDEAPTNPPPSPGTTERQNASPVGAAVGGAVGGVIVLIIIIAIIGFCCWKKRKASQQPGKKGADLPLNENGDSRPNRPSKGRAPTNDKKPLNDEIIYSEVHAINQPHPNTAMVRPTQRADRPPEVEYTSIDFLKTDKQKGNPAPSPGRQPVGMEYESVERGTHGDYRPSQPQPAARRAPKPPVNPPPTDSD